MTSTGMTHMFAINQLMTHLNSKIRSNSTYFEVSNDPFVNETVHMVIQMVLIGIFTGMAGYITNSFDKIIRLFNISSNIRDVINMIFNLFKKKEKQRHRIQRTVPLITSALHKNADLHTKLQWFISSDHCVKVPNTDLIQSNPVKEIYYVNMGVDINTTDKDVKLNESPLVGADMMIRFEDHDIKVRLTNEVIEVHGDLDTTKRDNMIYHLETYSDVEDSDILQRFCNYAIIKHNTTKQKWEQKLFNHNAGQWDNGTKCYSPNINSVVLHNGMKNEILGIMDFFHHNEKYYIDNGMRYKNILLCLGYPGTGKTTFSCALAARYRRHIYSINLANLTKPEDLKQLMDKFAQNVTSGIIMIDDIDHMFNTNTEAIESEELVQISTDVLQANPKTNIKPAKKYQVTMHELLGFFDGLNTVHGLVVIMCANDPLKFFKQDEHSFNALCRDQRINHIFEFQTCDRNMISQIYKNIFKTEPRQDLIENIEENYYAPCTIAKAFSSFYESNGGNIEGKQDKIDMILSDLANKTIKTNDQIIIEYSKKYQRDHPKQ